jgi:hypothetical protein
MASLALAALALVGGNSHSHLTQSRSYGRDVVLDGAELVLG